MSTTILGQAGTGGGGGGSAGYVDYPVQNNLYALPVTDMMNCIMGVLDTALRPNTTKPGNFEEWMLQNFGKVPPIATHPSTPALRHAFTSAAKLPFDGPRCGLGRDCEE